MVVVFVVISSRWSLSRGEGEEEEGVGVVGIEYPWSSLVFEGADVVEETSEPEPETEGKEVLLTLERARIVDVTVP